MKLLRALAIPFTVAADIATLGNMGERSFTQQLFDRDRDEREADLVIRLIEAASKKR